jgi:TPR repeat protein
MLRRPLVITAFFIVAAVLWWGYENTRLPPGVEGKGAQDWVPWISLAAAQTSASALNDQADAAYRRKDYPEAARLYRLSADQGNAYAQAILGIFYEQGRGGLPKAEREAARLYRLAADQGNAGGQVNLGVFYEQGRGGLPKDEREAARLYRLAADQGNADGQANLGDFYERGVGGLPRDEREAARLYRLAADQGITRAQSALRRLLPQAK